MSSTKHNQFVILSNEAQNCLVCEEMRDKTAVLSDLNGNIDPKVFFIAEAPGRQGADRTRRPFWGDKSGENFQKFLDSIGLSRDDIFITNAVLCSPRKPSGANRRPKKSEMKNCSAFLEKTVGLINPKIIVTLGAFSLEALKLLEYHQFSLRADVGKILKWNTRLLVPLYHPSPQVLASHRREPEQLKDYRVLAKAIRQIL